MSFQSFVTWFGSASETSPGHPGQGDEDFLWVSSSTDHQSRDLLWHCIDNEREEDCEDDKDNKSDDVLLELLPDEEDEGLHRVEEPSEIGGGTTGGTRDS